MATAIAVPAAANAYAVPDLLYPFEALEPYIDAPTMKIHHDKHHATYVANINKATEGKDEVDILELQLNALEAGPGVRNSGGGHYNHAFFWDEMAPPDEAAKTKPSAELEAAIDKAFGSFDEMKAKLVAQLHKPVLWTGTVRAMHNIGVKKLIESGPGKVLAGLTRRIEKSLTANAVLDSASVVTTLEEIK